MKMFNEPIALRMKACGGRDGDPKRVTDLVQTEEVNQAPLSDVIMTGKPNLETQVTRKASTQDSAEKELNRVTSGQWVVLSIMVSR